MNSSAAGRVLAGLLVLPALGGCMLVSDERVTDACSGCTGPNLRLEAVIRADRGVDRCTSLRVSACTRGTCKESGPFGPTRVAQGEGFNFFTYPCGGDLCTGVRFSKEILPFTTDDPYRLTVVEDATGDVLFDGEAYGTWKTSVPDDADCQHPEHCRTLFVTYPLQAPLPDGGHPLPPRDLCPADASGAPE